MDLTRPVEYRGLQLNDVAFNAPGQPLYGIQLEAADYSDVPGVGYSEKRAAADGFDVSDVTLGARQVQLMGTVYGINRGGVFDRLSSLRLAFSPTSAYADEPGEFGYLPLDFEVPTNDTAHWPSGFIAQCLRVRPLRGPSFNIRRDAIGGETDQGFGIPWQAQLVARDPRVYAQDEVDYTAWVGQTSGSGAFYNRGNYPAPLNILLAPPAGAATSVTTITIGGSTMQLTLPNNAAAQVLRYDGVHKVVTLQIGQVTSLRMDLLKFTAGITHPLILPGNNPFNWSRAAGQPAVGAGSHMWFWESWA